MERESDILLKRSCRSLFVVMVGILVVVALKLGSVIFWVKALLTGYRGGPASQIAFEVLVAATCWYAGRKAIDQVDTYFKKTEALLEKSQRTRALEDKDRRDEEQKGE